MLMMGSDLFTTVRYQKLLLRCEIREKDGRKDESDESARFSISALRLCTHSLSYKSTASLTLLERTRELIYLYRIWSNYV